MYVCLCPVCVLVDPVDHLSVQLRVQGHGSVGLLQEHSHHHLFAMLSPDQRRAHVSHRGEYLVLKLPTLVSSDQVPNCCFFLFHTKVSST